jgi:hypothetical protein
MNQKDISGFFFTAFDSKNIINLLFALPIKVKRSSAVKKKEKPCVSLKDLKELSIKSHRATS